jgi:hypothetical protein
MHRVAAVAVLSLLFVGCPAEVWIPMAPHRPAVARGHVEFLDSLPAAPHQVIGIITPPAGQFETEAEAVKAMRGIAAKYGADAIYIESKTETGGWRFEGMSGGSFSEMHLRAKAIVWK